MFHLSFPQPCLALNRFNRNNSNLFMSLNLLSQILAIYCNVIYASDGTTAGRWQVSDLHLLSYVLSFFFSYTLSETVDLGRVLLVRPSVRASLKNRLLGARSFSEALSEALSEGLTKKPTKKPIKPIKLKTDQLIKKSSFDTCEIHLVLNFFTID